jgi:hypothetical protein
MILKERLRFRVPFASPFQNRSTPVPGAVIPSGRFDRSASSDRKTHGRGDIVRGWNIGSGRIAAAWCVWAVLGTAVSAADNGLTVANPGQGTTYQLAYKFTPGQFARYEVVQKMTVISTYPQAAETMSNESTTTKHFRVVAAEADGAAQLEPIIDRVQMAIVFNGTERREFDSELNPNPGPEFAAMAGNIGKAQARVHMTPNGEMTKVTPLPGAPQALATLAAQNDSKLNFLIPLPKEAVGIGAVWRDRYQTPVVVGQGLTQPVTMQRQFELTKIEGSLATIAFKTSVITPLENPQIEAQLLQRKPAGTIEFDLDRGQIVSQTTKAAGVVTNAFGAGTKMEAALETAERLIPTTAGVQPATLKQ